MPHTPSSRRFVTPTHRELPLVRRVECSHDTLTVELSDGRRLSVPLEWYPRLVNGTEEERQHWELIGEGDGIHWPDLNEDLSVEGLLAGRPSVESAGSLQRWFDRRKRS